MADVSQWLNKLVLVTLVQPRGERCQGTISNLIPRQNITLDNAIFLGSQRMVDRIDIVSSNIEDLKVLPSHEVFVPAVTRAAPAPAPTAPAARKPVFQDPAILSMGRRPQSSQPDRTADNLATHQPNTAEKRAPLVPNPADHLTYSSLDDSDTTTVPKMRASIAQLSLEPTDPARLDTTEEETLEEPGTMPTAQAMAKSKRSRNRARRKDRNGNGDLNNHAGPSTSRPNRGEGWRQTPMLQSTKSFQPFASLKKSQKGRPGRNDANGWASEDVTDVQEAGDFDFQEGLAKFDKQTLFDEMKAQDEIDESQRLVSHNRIPRPKPGTAGGKNIHYSENVLDLPSPSTGKLKDTPDDFWKSEADDGAPRNGDRQSGQDGSGRTSRLRGASRVSTTRRSQSRKASTSITAGAGMSRVNSEFNPNPPGRLYMFPMNRRVETVTPLQMTSADDVAQDDFGFTEDLVAENAGRGISLVAIKALEDPALILRRQAATSSTSPVTIAILAGNHKSGSRAIAAGRHLRNHGLSVLVCVVGIDREVELLDDLRKQIRLFRNFGGTVYSKSELFEHLSKTATGLNSPPHTPVTLIIDALLGLTTSFGELRMSDQVATYGLMEWAANRIDAFAMSIDVPSGIDPTQGTVIIDDGANLYVRPRWIVSLGAPKKGLLEALSDRHRFADTEWVLYLADIGLGSVWRKTSAKIRRGIDFDGNWLVEMRYQPPSDE